MGSPSCSDLRSTYVAFRAPLLSHKHTYASNNTQANTHSTTYNLPWGATYSADNKRGLWSAYYQRGITYNINNLTHNLTIHKSKVIYFADNKPALTQLIISGVWVNELPRSRT